MFAAFDTELRIYVAGDGGIRTYHASAYSNRLAFLNLPECAPIGDLAVLDDDTLIVSCEDGAKLMKVDPTAGAVIDLFQCCEGVSDSFDPVAVVATSNGVVLAGTTRIFAFRADTGEVIAPVIDAGVAGAETYDEFVLGPSEQLYVAANPDIGVLEFSSETYEFVRILVPGGDEGVRNPKGLAFGADGILYVGSGTDAVIRMFDPATGDPIGDPIVVAERGSIDHIAFQP